MKSKPLSIIPAPRWSEPAPGRAWAGRFPVWERSGGKGRRRASVARSTVWGIAVAGCTLWPTAASPDFGSAFPQGETFSATDGVETVGLVANFSPADASPEAVLCQATTPAAPHAIWGVDGVAASGCGEVGWEARGCVNWQSFAQGEYAGHARLPHVPEYRIRVDDQIAFVFRLTREVSGSPDEFQVGDELRVESLTGDAEAPAANGNPAEPEDNIRRELVVQPDGTISLPLLEQIRAAGMTVEALRLYLEEKYAKYYKVPAITVTPIKINTRLEDLLSAVDARQGTGGLKLETVVNPNGRLYLQD